MQHPVTGSTRRDRVHAGTAVAQGGRTKVTYTVEFTVNGALLDQTCTAAGTDVLSGTMVGFEPPLANEDNVYVGTLTRTTRITTCGTRRNAAGEDAVCSINYVGNGFADVMFTLYEANAVGIYMPGGGGALAASGRDFIRAQQLRRECLYLVELHDIDRILLLFHGPTSDGPTEATCADYRRKAAGASAATIRDRQARDALELLGRLDEWAGSAAVSAYWCEVDAGFRITFREMDRGPDNA